MAPEIEVVAISDMAQRASGPLASRLGARTYDTVSDLLEDERDLLTDDLTPQLPHKVTFLKAFCRLSAERRLARMVELSGSDVETLIRGIRWQPHLQL